MSKFKEVYVVYNQLYEDIYIDSVFESKSEAEIYVAKLNKDNDGYMTDGYYYVDYAEYVPKE